MPPATTSSPSAPSRSPLVKCVRFVDVVAGFAAGLLVAGAVTLMVKGQDLSVSTYVVLGYVALFALGALFIELQLTSLARSSVFTTSWLARGLFYSFIGVITLEQDDLDSGLASSFVETVSWIFVIIGALYFVMGAVCIDKKHKKDLEAYEAATAPPA